MQFLKNLIKYLKNISGTSSHKSNTPIIEFPSFDDFKLFLPKYLSDENQENLLRELKAFPGNSDSRFYITYLKGKQLILQGDGYDQILAPNYEKKTFRPLKGFLVSNTCDASSENKRFYPRYLTFAPIIDLAKYQEVLENCNGDAGPISSHVEAIRKQQVSSFFYLPPSSGLNKECFVRFDCMFSVPASLYDEDTLFKKRIFTLSDLGFYLLLFKLSVHFSRVQESIQRNQP